MRDYPESKFDHIVHQLRKAASTSEMRYKHAAAIVYDRSVRAIGVNRYHQNLSMTTSIHAEVKALAQAGGHMDLTRASVFVIRVNSLNELRCSRPCNKCLSILKSRCVKKVYYSTDDGVIRCECICDMEARD